MDCTRIHGAFERNDCGLRAESGASAAAGRNAGVRFVFDSGALSNRCDERATRDCERRNIFDPLLAFLAALVSALVLSFLFRGVGKARTPGESGLAGRETDCVRLLADGRASGAVARTICDGRTERFFSVRLFYVLHIPADRRWCFVLAARLGSILGDDDVLRSGICDWLLHRDDFSNPESVVRYGGNVAQ